MASVALRAIAQQLAAPLVGERRRDGASSTSFWWRRWIEHSRSPSVDDAARAVGDDLHLDVARRLDVALEVDVGVAEAGQRLGARRLRAARAAARRRATIFMPRPPPPADALMITGKPISLDGRRAPASSVSRRPVPGRMGTPAVGHRLARGDLVAHQAHQLGRAGR